MRSGVGQNIVMRSISVIIFVGSLFVSMDVFKWMFIVKSLYRNQNYRCLMPNTKGHTSLIKMALNL